jgi:predicted Zn-dependent peptidase
VQLKRYKEQMIGQLTMSYENKASLAVSAAKSLLCYNRIDTPEELNKKINAITSTQLAEAANEIFDRNMLSSLHFKPLQ